MATLTGQIFLAVLFCFLGLWHLFTASISYLRFPREYRARAWQPLPWGTGRLRSLELYVILLVIPVAIFYELGISTGFHPLEHGTIPDYRIATFQHTVVLVMFWLFAFVALVTDTSQLYLPVELPFVLVGTSFLIEYSVMAEEADHNAGFEGKLSSCLLIIIGASALCSFLLAWNPRAFFVEFLFCMSLILQGTWLFQAGLSLHVEMFMPEGCHVLLDLPGGVNGSTQCDLEDAKIRAMELTAFAFHCHVVAVLLSSIVSLGIVARLHGYKRAGYDPLNYDAQDPDAVHMKPMLKINKR